MSVTGASLPRPGGEIKRQIQLPLSKAFEISLKSIKIRLARSVITAFGILLGIAFFASVKMAGVFTDIQKQIITEKKQAIAAGMKPTPEDLKMIAAAESSKEEALADANRLQWLSGMALLVCTVGITNAMLMSVTERYKEIGTMKCLGALDSFIVKLFFIEACLMGLIASAAGFVVGWLVVSLFHLGDGLSAFGSMYWISSLRLFGMSIGIGTLLTFLATIAPAYRAAKMPAAAALRVEI